ncbi:MAG: insulinase family protein [Deltaproteobacteria bacterium]|nr:insulinase family protein [Deltaproteobacteria bacterium]
MIVRTVLDNGIRLLTEDVPAVESVSIGLWVSCGARDENVALNGVSHFIEHMLFKGTQSRSAYDIASQIEVTGGHINACTGKENTSYYLKLPEYHLTLGLEILADMVINPAFDCSEIENEKSVVLSEISQLEDTPEEYIHDIFEASFWQENPLGLPILGSRESVHNFTDSAIREFFSARYNASNILISIAVAIDQQKTIRLVEDIFGSLATPNGTIPTRKENFAAPKHFRTLQQRKTQQLNVLIGSPAFGATNPQRYTMAVLNAVLGGTMSSRLFQEVREKRGLAYSIGSFFLPYSDSGIFCTFVGTSCDNFYKVVSCCADEYKKMEMEILSAKELSNAKEMLKGGFLLSMEGTDARMNIMARNENNFSRQLAPAEIMQGIDAVSAEGVRNLASNILSPQNNSILVLGKMKDSNFQKAMSLF